MELSLVLSDAPPNVRGRFDTGGRAFTIGRDAGCDWHLPDPTRLVSSVHCTVELRNGSYVLTDRSRNGTRALTGAGPLLLAGGSVRLAPGTALEVGPYRIDARAAAVTPSAPSSALETSFEVDDDLAHRLERAAGMEPGTLRGRGAGALAGDVVAALGAAVAGLRSLRAAADGDAEHPVEPATALADLLDPHVELSPAARVEALALELLDHERAMRAATEVALFRLLNELSPPTIEARARGDARCWRAFRERWEAMATGSENGMLDGFRDAREAAYRERMGER